MLKLHNAAPPFSILAYDFFKNRNSLREKQKEGYVC